jgi:hypothetical protein
LIDQRELDSNLGELYYNLAQAILATRIATINRL